MDGAVELMRAAEEQKKETHSHIELEIESNEDDENKDNHPPVTSRTRSELHSHATSMENDMDECDCQKSPCAHDEMCQTCKTLPKRHKIHGKQHSHYHPFVPKIKEKKMAVGAFDNIPTNEIVTAARNQNKANKGKSTSAPFSHRCVLNPDAPFFPKWDIFMLVLLSFTASFTPYEVAFLGANTTLTFINRTVDTCFLTDMVLNFLKAYFDTAKNKWVWNHRDIAIAYMKGWFFLDFVSTFPFEFIVQSTSDSDSASSLKLLRFFRLFRLFKLLRVVRASRIIGRWETVIDLRYSLLSLAGFVFSIVFLAHWGACLWGMVPAMDEKQVNWMTVYGVDDMDPASKYLAALYWSFMTVTTIGYGDVQPITHLERAVALVFMALGAALYAYIVGSVCSVLSRLDQATNDFHQTMDHLNAYMEESKTSYELRVKLRTFFVHCQGQYSQLLYERVLQRMSPGLRGQFILESHSKWVNELGLFKNIPLLEREPFLIQLVMFFKMESFPPREEIIHPGEKPEKMYVVAKGMVSRLGKLLSKGKAFGEDFVLRDTPFGRRYYAVRSLSYTDVWSLEQKNLYSIIGQGEFPMTRRVIKIQAAKMLFIRWCLAESARRLNHERKLRGETQLTRERSSKSRGQTILEMVKEESDAMQAQHHRKQSVMALGSAFSSQGLAENKASTLIGDPGVLSPRTHRRELQAAATRKLAMDAIQEDDDDYEADPTESPLKPNRLISTRSEMELLNLSRDSKRTSANRENFDPAETAVTLTTIMARIESMERKQLNMQRQLGQQLDKMMKIVQDREENTLRIHNGDD